MDGTRPASGRGARRANGILVLVGVVVVGLLTGTVFYRWKRRTAQARIAAEIEAAPRTPEGRVALWLRLAGPQIHHRLAVVARFAPDMPWLVTHAVSQSEGPPELWGIDCGALPRELARLEGLSVVVDLPRPRALGRMELSGPRARRVPLFASEARPDPAARLAELALYLLEGMPDALRRDVPGAALTIRVAER
jgi:hypothetical protein